MTYAFSQIFFWLSLCSARRSAFVSLTAADASSCSFALEAAAASAASACDSQSSSQALGMAAFLLIAYVCVGVRWGNLIVVMLLVWSRRADVWEWGFEEGKVEVGTEGGCDAGAK